MASYGMIYIPNFMKIGASIQAILRFCIRNLRLMLVLLKGGSYELRH
jgi:hypothetical protein